MSSATPGRRRGAERAPEGAVGADVVSSGSSARPASTPCRARARVPAPRWAARCGGRRPPRATGAARTAAAAPSSPLGHGCCDAHGDAPFARAGDGGDDPAKFSGPRMASFSGSAESSEIWISIGQSRRRIRPSSADVNSVPFVSTTSGRRACQLERRFGQPPVQERLAARHAELAEPALTASSASRTIRSGSSVRRSARATSPSGSSRTPGCSGSSCRTRAARRCPLLDQLTSSRFTPAPPRSASTPPAARRGQRKPQRRAEAIQHQRRRRRRHDLDEPVLAEGLTEDRRRDDGVVDTRPRPRRSRHRERRIASIGTAPRRPRGGGGAPSCETSSRLPRRRRRAAATRWAPTQ